MSVKKSVSMIIPTKDRLRLIKQVLPTYLQQPELLEVIFIVDGSTDGTQTYLRDMQRKHPQIIMLDNGTNKGIPYSRNRGIDAAKGRYIFSAEDDLELTPDFFATLIKHLSKAGADVLCGRNIFRFDYETAEQAIARTDRMTGNPVNTKTIEITTSIKLADDTEQLMIASPMFARADVFRAVRFDERYRVNFWREETDFQISAAEAGYTLASCPHAICFNFMITNDKGGVRATVGFRRAKWIIRNNWRFIQKHRVYLAEHFNIGNPYWYIVKFSVRKVVTEAIFPLLSPLKRRLLGK